MLSTRKALRGVALGIWLLLAGSYLAYLYHQGKSPFDAVIGALHWLKTDSLAPAAFTLAFVSRPVLLVPAALLSAVAGHCFGAALGLWWAMVGAATAGAVGYAIGRAIGPRPVSADERRRGVWRQLADRGLETTVTARILMLPYDLVSLVCGGARVPFFSFLAGTALGNLPGTLSCVLFGAGIQGEFRGELPSLDWRYQGPALLLLALAFILKALMRKRHPETAVDPPDPGGSVD